MQGKTAANVNQAATERYNKKRRKMTRLFRRLWKKRESQNIESYMDRGEAQKFYQKVKSKVFGTGIPTCKDKDGYLVTDTQSVLQIWSENFHSLLVPEGSISDEITPIIDDGVDCPLPCQNEISMAIARLKINKAAGAYRLMAEICKAGEDELATCMLQLINTVWLKVAYPMVGI